MLKVAGVALIMGLLSFNLVYGAVNKMEDFAASPLIKNLILKVEGGKVKAYYKTASGDDKELDSVNDKNFRYAFDKGETKAIYLEGFNPLEVSVKLDSTEDITGMNDPGLFFKALSVYSPIFSGKQDFQIIRLNASMCIPIKYCMLIKAYYNIPPDNDDITKSLSEQKELKELAVTEEIVADWKSKTSSSAGIDSVIDSINELTGKLDKNVDNISKSINDIVNDHEDTKLDKISVIDVAQISYIVNKSTEARSNREAASTNLKALSNYLKKFKSDWVGTNYKIGSISQPATNNLQKVAINIKKMEITAKDNVISIKESDKGSISNTFTVYQNENVLFEGALGFVYSPLKSQKFSTNTVNGNLVVEKTENNDNYHAAAFLNIYKTNLLRESVYPFFQLGVSTAKDYPAILTGIGAKIRGTSFALSSGAAFGFIKELDKLSEGSIVTGQAEIDKDEKSVIKPSWYLSLQYSF